MGTTQQTFYFYDLETSGFSPREARIMQFAGQRTDLDLRPIGDPHNVIIRLADDVIPDPDAILVTGITPQFTRAEGLNEAEFLKIFVDEIAVPGTIFVGFNSIRFDDEFMRFLQYRNFHDAYEWQWKDDRSRWDLLDLVRITRALRPAGIEWPVASDGSSANRLEMLAKVNNLTHSKAHDALSDVEASIALAKLIQDRQPKLFSYLLSVRDKKAVANLVEAGQPFIYTSGKYPSEYEKTTVVATIGKHPKKQAVLVFDLRHDPRPFAAMAPEALAEAWRWHEPGSKITPLPVKVLQYNRCPAIAPLQVLDADSQERLKISMPIINKNLQWLKELPEFLGKLEKAVDILEKQQQTSFLSDEKSVDGQLYDGFIGDKDRRVMGDIRTADPASLDAFIKKFDDDRLKKLVPLYKARNFPASLNADERQAWDQFCQDKLMAGGEKSRLAKYFARIAELRAMPSTSQRQHDLLTDLELYGQSLLPGY